MNSINSLYIHFPYCVKICNYCDFFKSELKDYPNQIKSYHEYFDKAWGKLKIQLNDNQAQIGRIKNLFIGGGTPSLWGSEGAIFLEKFLKNNDIGYAKDYEFTMEVNPESALKSDFLNDWESVGVNRFSIGIQSLNQDFLPLLNRAHSALDAQKLIQQMGKRGRNFSVDFMLGLPESIARKRNIKDELSYALDNGAQHISAYILTVAKSYLHFSKLPDEEYIRDEYLNVCEFLQTQGMQQYETSNFAYPGKHSQHNMNYWQSGQYLALGPSSVGQFWDKNKHMFRFKWANSKIEFISEEHLNAKQLNLEKVYLSLRIIKGLDLLDFFWKRQAEAYTNTLNLLNKWQKEGLGIMEKERFFSLTPKGQIILDDLASQLILAQQL